MAAAHTSAHIDLRAYRPDNECTTASNIVGAEGLRLRRIKTFESLRPALVPSAAPQRPVAQALAGLYSGYCPRRAAPRGWRLPAPFGWETAARACAWPPHHDACRRAA